MSGGTTKRTVGDGLSVVQRMPMSRGGLVFACPVPGGTTAGGVVVGAAERNVARRAEVGGSDDLGIGGAVFIRGGGVVFIVVRSRQFLSKR